MTDRNVRWELAAAAGRLRHVERDLSEWQQRHDELDRELLREQRRALRLRNSRSYRLSRAVVTLVKHPVRGTPELAGKVLRKVLRRGGGGTELLRTREKKVPAPRPAWLYLALGLDVAQLEVLIGLVQQRLLVTADHKPVLVTDNPDFSLLRKLGVLIEYVPDAAAWSRHRPDLDWEDVLTDRLSQLHRDHQPARSVVVDPDAPPTLADLLH